MKKIIYLLTIAMFSVVLSACATSKTTECTCPCHNNHNTEASGITNEDSTETTTPYRFEGFASTVQFVDGTNISLYDASHWCPDSIKIEKISSETAKITLQYTDGYGEVTTETLIVDYSKIAFIVPFEK